VEFKVTPATGVSHPAKWESGDDARGPDRRHSRPLVTPVIPVTPFLFYGSSA